MDWFDNSTSNKIDNSQSRTSSTHALEAELQLWEERVKQQRLRLKELFYKQSLIEDLPKDILDWIGDPPPQETQEIQETQKTQETTPLEIPGKIQAASASLSLETDNPDSQDSFSLEQQRIAAEERRKELQFIELDQKRYNSGHLPTLQTKSYERLPVSLHLSPSTKQDQVLPPEAYYDGSDVELSDSEGGTQSRRNPVVYRAHQKDEVDVAVRECLSRFGFTKMALDVPSNFRRLGPGVYAFGTKKIRLEVRGKQLLVRVGGGVVSFPDFVAKYGELERRKTAFRSKKIDLNG